VRPQLAGTVQVRITIDPTGIPQKIAWAGGDSRLTQTAIDTIKRWRYQPATLNGRAVESEAVVTITIALHQ
jgi:protein TonB